MIFILGEGRSGTSTVARLLHEHGVPMGYRFRDADNQNPNGYFEDREFVDLNQFYLSRRLTYADFLTQLKLKLNVRDVQSGLKDPRLCYFINEYRLLHQQVFNEQPILIRCIRPKELVVTSMAKCYDWSQTEAEEVFTQRSQRLDAINKLFTIIVNFANMPTDTDILKQLKGIIDGRLLSPNVRKTYSPS